MTTASLDPTETQGSIPLQAEELSVSRQVVVGDTVRVEAVTREQDQIVEQELRHERIEVERVPIGCTVEAVPPVRQEGDVTIMPVVEEVVVVERRLILKEEVRIRRVRSSELHRENVTLRKQDAVITRIEAVNPAVGTDRRFLED